MKDLSMFCEDMDNIASWYEWKDLRSPTTTQQSIFLRELARKHARKPRKFLITNVPTLSSNHPAVMIKLDTQGEAVEYAQRSSKLSWVRITEIHGYNILKGKPVIAFYGAFRMGNEIRKWTQATLKRYTIDLKRVC